MQLGMIGLGRMGANLVLRLMRDGHTCVAYDVSKDAVEEVWKSDEVLSNHYGTSIHLQGYLYGFDGRQEEGARLRCVLDRR